jgi:hypothetical protein
LEITSFDDWDFIARLMEETAQGVGVTDGILPGAVQFVEGSCHKLEVSLWDMDVGVRELQLSISAGSPATRENGGAVDVGALDCELPSVLSSSLQKLQVVDIFTLNAFGVVATELDVRGFAFFHAEVNCENHVLDVPVIFELVHEVSLGTECVGEVGSQPDEPVNLRVVRLGIAKEDGSEIIEDLVSEADFHFVFNLRSNKSSFF